MVLTVSALFGTKPAPDTHSSTGLGPVHFCKSKVHFSPTHYTSSLSLWLVHGRMKFFFKGTFMNNFKLCSLNFTIQVCVLWLLYASESVLSGSFKIWFYAEVSNILESCQAALERPDFVGRRIASGMCWRKFQALSVFLLGTSALAVWLFNVQVTSFFSLYSCQNILCSFCSFSEKQNNLIYLKYLNKLHHACFQGLEGK